MSWPTCSHLTLTVSSALQSGGSPIEPPVALSHLLLVSGLDETEHHLCQHHASSCLPCQAAICPIVGHLTAHGPDEIGADFPLVLTYLQ